MAEKSGFFNAIITDGVPDRQYDAKAYSDSLAVIIGNGVRRSEADDLKVTANGMVAVMNSGYAWINGHYYINTASKAFSIPTAPSGGARWDRIVIRCDDPTSARTVHAVYLTGTAGSNPAKPTITRNDSIYDIVIAEIYVPALSTSPTVNDTRGDASVCGWVYSVVGDDSFFKSLDNSFEEWFSEKREELANVTLYDRYEYTTTMTAAAPVVPFNIPQYDSTQCYLSVYVNGLLRTDYTMPESAQTLIFTTPLQSGDKVVVYCYKSVDIEGINTISFASRLTSVEMKVSGLESRNKLVYKMSGADDSTVISEIVKALYDGRYTVTAVNPSTARFLEGIGGNGYLISLPEDAQITLYVVGNGTQIYDNDGLGTSADPYKYIVMNDSTNGNRKVVVDFTDCAEVTVEAEANTYNQIFAGNKIFVRGLNLKATGTGVATEIIGFKPTSRCEVENSRIDITSSANARIATGGTFTNCNGVIKSTSAQAVCFEPTNEELIRIHGGTYRAYVGNANFKCAITSIPATLTNAVIFADNINCPNLYVANYHQINLAIGNAGNTFINGAISVLPIAGGNVSANAIISKSKID